MTCPPAVPRRSVRWAATDLDPVLRNLGVRTIVGVGVSRQRGHHQLRDGRREPRLPVRPPTRRGRRRSVRRTRDAMIDNTLSLLATIVSTEAVARAWQARLLKPGGLGSDRAGGGMRHVPRRLPGGRTSAPDLGRVTFTMSVRRRPSRPDTGRQPDSLERRRMRRVTPSALARQYWQRSRRGRSWSSAGTTEPPRISGNPSVIDEHDVVSSGS